MKNVDLKTVFFALLLITAIALIIFIPGNIKVRLECRSQYGACPPQINSLLTRYESYSLRKAKIGIRREFKEVLWVSDYSFQYKLPNILTINLIARDPAFAIRVNNSENFLLVDREGLVIALSAETKLPTILVDSDPIVPGENVSAKYLFALELQDGVNQLYNVNIGRVEDGSLTVELVPEVKVIFPLQGDVDLLLGSLRIIYSKIEDSEGAKAFSEIDLRFKNPVLR